MDKIHVVQQKVFGQRDIERNVIGLNLFGLIFVAHKIGEETFLDINHTGQTYAWTKFMLFNKRFLDKGTLNEMLLDEICLDE